MFENVLIILNATLLNGKLATLQSIPGIGDTGGAKSKSGGDKKKNAKENPNSKSTAETSGGKNQEGTSKEPGEAPAAGGEGGGGPGAPGGDGDEPPKEPPKVHRVQPPSSTAKRVLILAQKGDWPACEQALKVLERSVAEGTEAKPLENVFDNVTGNTPLMYAAMENKIAIMERMIELGCDINAKNKVRS